MKRFGGFQFLPLNNSNIISLIDEKLINRLINTINIANQSSTEINATLIASLFEIHRPQVSVRKMNESVKSLFIKSLTVITIFN